MNRPGGLPLIYWIAALGLGAGALVWIRRRGASSSPGTAASAGQPAFTQAQEVQDFQIFSALTGAQQASDLNMLTEVAGLFAGGSSTGTNTAGGSAVPSPPSTGTAPPTTVPSSSITYGSPGSPNTTTFAAPPPPGAGYVWTGKQWVVDPGQGVGYVPVPA